MSFAVPLVAPSLRPSRAALPALLVVAIAAGCSRGESRQVAARTVDGVHADSVRPLAPPAGVTLPVLAAAGAAPYTVSAATQGGTIAGRVELAGAAPADSAFDPGDELRGCGARVVHRAVTHRGAAVGDVVVWLADARTGKALPTSRRVELDLEGCQLAPLAQGVVAGSTLNVHGRDPIDSRLRLARQPGGASLGLVRMTDAGQVVPDDRALAQPGIVEARGERPAWLRAWLLVFDHPYFATTDADGAFSLADVPPGTYTLRAWHERLGQIEQRVTVTAGQPAAVTLRFGDAPATTTSSAGH